MNESSPYIAAEQSVAELTVRGVILAIVLTVLLAMSNAYLALKLGILTSASIPAAIISMGVLRFFKNSSILENNAVQTAASAGEAVAGGIVYTIPALILIGYWQHFDYLTNFLIAAIGGIFGVLFSIPLRRVLVNDRALRFPEGRAIAEILKSSAEKMNLRDIVLGGVVGGAIELLQVGFKLIASHWTHWFKVKSAIFGIGVGFSATMVGAGYLIGFDMALSIFLGAIIAWLGALPVLSQCFPDVLQHHAVQEAATLLWQDKLRYLGIGAMLFAGIWTFIKLLKPLARSMRDSFRASLILKHDKGRLPRTDQDIPTPFIVMGVCFMAAVLFLFFQFVFPLGAAGLDGTYAPSLVFFAVIYVVVIGVLFSVITAYFSGMVGVTASPGSSMVIAGVLLISWLLLSLVNSILPTPLTVEQIRAVEAIAIIIGAVVTGIAAIANDNSQDLKVGQLVGATPWKQQLMLLLGVVVSALVIPPVMQLLFDVYGIGGVVPREGMDPAQSLPAPPAALLAAVTDAVFHRMLPWGMIAVGGGIILLVIALNALFRLKRFIQLSILGVAIGMYLPLASSFPLFVGGLIAFVINRHLHRKPWPEERKQQQRQVGALIACGLVAGSALMDIVLAIPFSILHSANALSLAGESWELYSVLLGVGALVLLAIWIDRRVCSSPDAG